MYVVIFTATVAQLDDQYAQMAARMRDLAFSDYGCLGFEASLEGDTEIAVSYWPDLESIKRWKSNADHLAAQNLGRQKWYRSYKIDIARVERSYGFPAEEGVNS